MTGSSGAGAGTSARSPVELLVAPDAEALARKFATLTRPVSNSRDTDWLSRLSGLREAASVRQQMS